MVNVPIVTPNHNILFAGNSDAGFYGEVEAVDFIDMDEFKSKVGYSLFSFNSNTNWLMFSLDGKKILTTKKPIGHSVSWSNLETRNLVFGNKTIEIGGKTYAVRLFRGAENNPSNNTDEDRDAIGSEWNRLMLPISAEAPNSFKYPKFTGVTEDWGIGYSNADLGQGSGSLGYWNWCQETVGSDSSLRVIRGNYDGLSVVTGLHSNNKLSDYGWRPVLELIGESETSLNSSKVKINGQWKANKQSFVKVDGTWRNLKSTYTKIDGQWK